MNEPSSIPSWIQIIGSLGTLVVAIAVGYVAWRQWRTTSEKLRLDLHEHRYDIYQGFQSFRTSIELNSHVTDEDRVVLARASRETKFFFNDKELIKLADDLWKQGWICVVNNERYEGKEETQNRRWREWEAASDEYIKLHDRWKARAEPMMRIGW